MKCCLCGHSLTDPSFVKKRKKLHGTSCAQSMEVLQSLAMEITGLSLESFVETQVGAWLCHQCDGKLAKISKLKTDICKNLSTLNRVQGTASERLGQSLAGSKRATEGGASNAPKQVRVDSAQQPSLSQHPVSPTQEQPGHQLCPPPLGPEQTPPSLSPQASLPLIPDHPIPHGPQHSLSPSTEQIPTADSQSQTSRVEQGSEQTSSQKQSPTVTVSIGYPSGPKEFKVSTPARKRSVKRLARHSYSSLATAMVTSPATSDKVIKEVARKIRCEMKSISSDKHDSILLDSIEAVKHFSWETVWLELNNKIPTLVMFLALLITNPSKKKPLISFIASQLLKQRYSKLGLVQRAVSIALYGNGTNKQVYTCLHPLMVCMSYTGTLKVVDRLCDDFDAQVHFWCDDLHSRLEDLDGLPNRPTWVPPPREDTPSDEDTESVSAPPYSPLSSLNGDTSESDDGSESDGESMTEDQTTMSSVAQQQQQAQTQLAIPETRVSDEWSGFKIVGDNIDRNIRRSFQRIDMQTLSLHYFHCYAVRDRVDLFTYSDCPPDHGHSKINPITLLPTQNDITAVQKDFEVLVARIIVEHMPDFEGQAKEVEWHIPFEFGKEMAQKSCTVPLGVHLLNENKLDEMSKIMESLHKYVPTRSGEGNLTLPNGETLTFDNTRFFEIFLGGDQLTVARAAGVQALRLGHETAHERLEGLVPVVEDWHARVVLLKVIWQRLYSKKSACEKGTLYQLKNIVNRTGVPTDPEDGVKATEDFLLLVLHAHVVAAARLLHSHNQTDSVAYLAKCVVASFVNLTLSETGKDPTGESSRDGVHLYALEVITLGLLWLGFYDAIKEGDGERVLRYWKFLLVLFKSTNHYNYAKEAVSLLVQYKYTFSKRKAAQLQWSRFVNTKGRPGCNMPCDLYMEHLNRRIKTILRNLGSNINPNSIIRAGKSVGVVHRVCLLFEEETVGDKDTDYHPTPKLGKDFGCVLQVIEDEKVMLPLRTRHHPSFPFKRSLLQKLARNDLVKKIQTNIEQCVYVQ